MSDNGKKYYASQQWVLDQLKNNPDIGAQSDWAINDETNSAFIKNKPFGEILGESIITLSETTLEFTEAGYSGLQYLPERINLIHNENYIITWDGIEYQCISDSFSGEAIGDNSILVSSTSSNFNPNAPFFIWETGAVIAKEAGIHTFKIEQREVEIRQIDEKYLPDGIKVKVNPDWAVNNETDPAFIKNKPFGEEITEEIYVENQNLVFVYIDNNIANFTFNSYKDFSIEPTSFNIYIDDVLYENIVSYESGIDMEMYIEFNDEAGEIISICLGSRILTAPQSYADGEHTIKITSNKPSISIKKIDEKYLPDTVAYKEDLMAQRTQIQIITWGDDD